MKRTFSLFSALLVLFTSLYISPVFAKQALDVSADSYLVTNAETGRILLAEQENSSIALREQLVIFALLTAVKDADLTQYITIPDHLPLPNNSLQLASGQLFTLRDLIEMTALNSSTHSLYSIAYGLYGSPESYAEAIQKEAESLGCKNTFVHSLDFDDSENKTTLTDLAIAGREYIETELFFNLSRTVCKEFMEKDAQNPFLVYCTNSLVSNYKHSSYLYGNAYGMKEAYGSDGTADLLLTLTKKGNKELIVAIANNTLSEDEVSIYKDARTISEYIFDGYASTTLIRADDPVSEYAISNAAKGTHIILKAGETQLALLPSELSEKDIEKKIVYHNDIKAPIKKGDILGDITFYFQGNVIGETTLYSDRDVSFQPTVTLAGAVFRILSHPITIFVIVVAMLAFVLFFVNQVYQASRKSKKRSQKRKK